MANNKTIFQRLNSIFDASGVDLTKVNAEFKNTTNSYSINNDILLKTPSKEEYDLAKLQAQQSKFLSGLWRKSENELLQHSLHYETTRIGSYADFESMEFYPEIAAALDIFMEESTTVNSKGRVLNVYSESKRIQGVLEDLFFNRLDIHLSIPMWTRNICKYGDNFLLLNIDDTNGIVGARQLPNFEIERKEGDVVYNQYSGEYKINNENENAKVKFFWRGRDFEFNSWQIAHFRLLGDDRRLPYGTSLLEKARSIWKRLQLAEDAMLVYRITRAPERRVYKIFVGNLDDKDVPAYVDEIANRFKRRPVIDPQTGQIDLRYNQLANDQDYFIPVRDENAATPIDTLQGACIALDTRIPLLDGRTLELQEIIKEWDNGNRDLWVYSCNPETGELAPGMITWAGETRKNAEVIKITLDNGESIITTPDHKWVHRTNGFVEAKDLKVGDSLMPFYRDTKKIKSNTNGKYERVWDSAKQEWVFTHRMVTDTLNEFGLINEYLFDDKYTNEIKNIRHHKDFNRFNNNPSNLVWMNGADHMKYHQSVIKETIWSNPEENINKIRNGVNSYIGNLTEEEKNARAEISRLNSINSRDKAVNTFNNNPNKLEIIKRTRELTKITKNTKEYKEKVSKNSKELWKLEDYRNKVFSKEQKLIFTDELYNMFFEMFKLEGRADLTLDKLNKSDEFMNEFITPNKDIRSSLTNLNKFTHKHLEKMLKTKGFKNYREWCRVTAEELGYKNVRAWRYFIEKNNKENNLLYNHKIISIEWLEDKMNTGTITVDGNELYHNYHTFATESGVFIKNSNLDQIGDIQYLQRKLFTALRVPKSFLGFEEAVGDGKNLALQDIRFSRTINRIQQAVISELNKIAIIHLYMLGFEDELNNFSLSLNNPSTQAEMLKIEQLQAKMSVYKDAISEAGNGFMAMSMTRARREILGWSDEEIRKDLLEQRLEKAAAAEIENTSSVIKTTGMFDEVDSIYGDLSAVGQVSNEEGGDMGSAGGGGGSFGGGGGLPPLGGEPEGGGLETPEGGLETPEGSEGGLETPETPEAGGEAPETPEAGGEAPTELSERFNGRKKLIKENTTKRNNLIVEKQDYVNKLLDIIDSNDKPLINERVVVYDKNLKINEHINSIIKDIDDMLKD